MYLSKLEVFGFKSFAQKINLSFDSGLTAIVGPNGCGKTNVVDAIRWALGEQRPTMLRSDKMEDVIFNGTKNRKPLSIAEVSLTIENTKRDSPVGIHRSCCHTARLPLRRKRILPEQDPVQAEGHPRSLHGYGDGI